MSRVLRSYAIVFLQARYPSFLSRHSPQKEFADTHTTHNPHSANVAQDRDICRHSGNLSAEKTANPLKPLLAQSSTSKMTKEDRSLHKTEFNPLLGCENQPPTVTEVCTGASYKYNESGAPIPEASSGVLSLGADFSRQSYSEVLALREEPNYQSNCQTPNCAHENYSKSADAVKNENAVTGLRLMMSNRGKNGPLKLNSLLMELLKVVEDPPHISVMNRRQ